MARTVYGGIDATLSPGGDIGYNWNARAPIPSTEGPSGLDRYSGTDFTASPGDVSSTESDHSVDLVQQLLNVIKSTPGDWREHPSIGAALEDFIGEPNTRDTASRIEERIRRSIVSPGLVFAEDLKIDIIPVDIHSLLITVVVQLATTRNNRIQPEEIVLTYLFDLKDQGPILVPNDERSHRSPFASGGKISNIPII